MRRKTVRPVVPRAALFAARSLCASVVFTAAAGCAAPEAQSPQGGQHRHGAQATATSGRDLIILAQGSAELKQLRTSAVGTAELPVDEVVAPGRVAVNPNRVAHIVLPLPGRIDRVMVQLGATVTTRQPLLTIESPDADAAIAECEQAAAMATLARAAVQKAQADLDRVSDLFSHKAAAKRDVLNAEQELTQARTGLSQAEASCERTRWRLRILGLQPGEFGQKVTVRAPLSGKVLDISVTPGEYRNDTSAVLMTIADLRTVWVTSDIPEGTIRLIQVGERVEVELVAYPGEVFAARVARIADTVDPRTRTIQVQAEVSNQDGRLRPEMFGRFRHSHGLRKVPVVPAQAVVQTEAGSTVFVERSTGVFARTLVTTGQTRDGQVPILSGLKPGDRVVVEGAILLRDRPGASE